MANIIKQRLSKELTSASRNEAYRYEYQIYALYLLDILRNLLFVRGLYHLGWFVGSRIFPRLSFGANGASSKVLLIFFAESIFSESFDVLCWLEGEN